MIYAVNMTCNRDLALEELMAKTLEKYCPECDVLLSLNTDDTPYANGAGWPASMMKLEAIRQLLNENDVQDNDFVLSVDSDVVFTYPEVFKYASPEYGIVGILGQQPWNTIYGKWAHLSGCLIFIRGDIAKKMCQFTEEELHNIRYNEFKTCDMTENEDVVLSYLAMKCGAKVFDLLEVPWVTSGDFEGDMRRDLLMMADDSNNDNQPSFYHLNYCPTQFLGEPVTGKWDIPRILQMKGIEL